MSAWKKENIMFKHNAVKHVDYYMWIFDCEQIVFVIITDQKTLPYVQ